MKILKILLIILMLFVALVVGFALMLDKNYEVEVSTTIEAKPEAIHVYVGDLKKWDDWTPFKESDPTVKVTFGDTTTGVGASQTWTGDQGGGSLTFTKSDAKTGIAYDMEISGGDDSNKMPASCEILYSADGDKTKVTWTMKGEAEGFWGGVIASFIPTLVGQLYTKGLGNLKTAVEKKSD